MLISMFQSDSLTGSGLEGTVYQYKVLTFGLSTSPRIFTKVLVLDDILIHALDPFQLCQDLNLAISTFMEADYVINH